MTDTNVVQSLYILYNRSYARGCAPFKPLPLPGAAFSLPGAMKKKRNDWYLKLYEDGHRAYQLGQQCQDMPSAWQDGWYAARNENLHIEEEWASLFPRGEGLTIRRRMVEGEG